MCRPASSETNNQSIPASTASLGVGIKQTLWHVGELATDNYEWDVALTENIQSSLEVSILSGFSGITSAQAETAAATIIAAIKTSNFRASLSSSATAIFSQTDNADNTSVSYGVTGTIEFILGTIYTTQVSAGGSISALWTNAATDTANVTGTAYLRLSQVITPAI